MSKIILVSAPDILLDDHKILVLYDLSVRDNDIIPQIVLTRSNEDVIIVIAKVGDPVKWLEFWFDHATMIISTSYIDGRPCCVSETPEKCLTSFLK